MFTQKRKDKPRRRFREADADLTTIAFILIILAFVAVYSIFNPETLAMAKEIEEPPTIEILAEPPRLLTEVPEITFVLLIEFAEEIPPEPELERVEPPESEVQLCATVLASESYDDQPNDKRGVVCTILNRVASDNPYYPSTVAGVVRQPGAFSTSRSRPISENDLDVAYATLSEWYNERECGIIGGDGEFCSDGDAYPMFFASNGKSRTNKFRNQY